MTTLFNIAGAKLTYANLDMDFLVRFKRSEDAERVVSPRVLKEELDSINEKFFCKFYSRAYQSGKEVTTCKLRSGVQVQFVLR